MPEVYPHSDLPGPIYDGNSYQQIDPVLRTPLDAGGYKPRRRFTKTPTIWKVRFRFVSELEFQIFEAWHRFKINDGADLFTMSITVSTGKSQSHSCYFTKMYKHVKTTDGVWDVTAEIMIDDRETQSESWLDTQLT